MDIILPIFQVIVSVLLVTVIIFQKRGSGLSGAFGGGGESYHTKRGFEKILFNSTVILASLFLLSTLAALFI